MDDTDKSPTRVDQLQEQLERTLLQAVKGVPVYGKEGELATHADGTPLIDPPPAQLLAVAVNYLKAYKPHDAGNQEPTQTRGELKGVLAAANRVLPFASKSS